MPNEIFAPTLTECYRDARLNVKTRQNQLKIKIRYFAVLREKTGRETEEIFTHGQTAEELFKEIAARYRLPFNGASFKAAVNNEFVPWETRLKQGDEVAFIPPVAGG